MSAGFTMYGQACWWVGGCQQAASILVTLAFVACAQVTVLAALFRCSPCGVDQVCIRGRFTWLCQLCGLRQLSGASLGLFHSDLVRYRCSTLWVHIQSICGFACFSCNGRTWYVVWCVCVCPCVATCVHACTCVYVCVVLPTVLRLVLPSCVRHLLLLLYPLR